MSCHPLNSADRSTVVTAVVVPQIIIKIELKVKQLVIIKQMFWVHLTIIDFTWPDDNDDIYNGTFRITQGTTM